MTLGEYPKAMVRLVKPTTTVIQWITKCFGSTGVGDRAIWDDLK
jgi:hypothetical protein